MTNGITINDLEVQSALAKLTQQLKNNGPVLNAIGGDVLKRVQMNFRNSQSPEGVSWKALKSRNGKPLLDTTRLRNSITYQVEGDNVSVGTNVVYAAVHQFGYTFDRAARSQHAYFNQAADGSISRRFVKKHKSNFAQRVTIGAHSVTIPARPFLPTNDLPPLWQASILKIIQTHLQQAI